MSFSTRNSLLILNYNHCRFFSKNFFNKKQAYDSHDFELFYHLKSLRPLYFFCMAHYCLSVVHSLTGLVEVLLLGFITQRQTILLCLCLFLACADVGTIFNRDSSYNLISVLIAQNSRKLFYYLFTCSVLFVGISVISYSLFYSTDNFASVQDSMVTLSCLMFGDSVLDVLDSLEDAPKILIGVLLFFIFIFFLNVLQIFLAVASVGFQKVQEEFNTIKTQRQEKLKKVQTKAQSLLRSKTRKMNLKEVDLEKELDNFVKNRNKDFGFSRLETWTEFKQEKRSLNRDNFKSEPELHKLFLNQKNWLESIKPKPKLENDVGFDESSMIRSILQNKSSF